MPHKILICGPNGAGKSTLGRALSKASGWKFVDTEDYYFPRPGDYTFSRSTEEVSALLLRDLQKYDNFIFAAVRGDFGDNVVSQFTHAVLVCAPRELRLERVRIRSGTDFADFAAARPDDLTSRWLEAQALPVLQVDGTRPPEENAAYILKNL